jgi:hypothetical protein
MGRNVENRRKWSRLHRIRNRDRINAAQRARYAINKKKKTPEQVSAHRAKERLRYKGKQHKEYHAIRTKRYRLKLKLDLITAYGGSCSCCGEFKHEFLTIEHLNKDGKTHRATLKSTNAVYRDIRDRDYPPGYTVLCFNCNIAKSLFGQCPHERSQS